MALIVKIYSKLHVHKVYRDEVHDEVHFNPFTITVLPMMMSMLILMVMALKLDVYYDGYLRLMYILNQCIIFNY